jgi:hypothetical protein
MNTTFKSPTPLALLSVAEATFQDVIRKHYQSAWRSYAWSADGCGDNLYRTSFDALRAYKVYQTLSVVMTQKQLDTEHA